MPLFPKRKPKPYVAERQRLVDELATLNPASTEYQTVLARLDELDRILNRTSELKKIAIPAFGTVLAIGGIYSLQQFAGVIVPRALEALPAKEQKKIPQYEI